MSPTPTTTSPTPRKSKTQPKPQPKPQPKRPSSSPGPLVRVSAAESSRVLSIPLDKLHRHPDNRSIADDSVEDLAASLREHGQREPLRVRPLADPIGHYEILSGERRYVAAKLVGLETLRCLIEEHADHQAKIELAIANAARKDLNPIERGELLGLLIRPVDAGGGGMDRAAAGRLFGLNSESGIKNALRLVRLPGFLRDQVASGELPIGKARPLLAYPGPILEAFAKWIQEPMQKYDLKNLRRPDADDSDELDSEIDAFIREHTRPCDALGEHYFGYQLGGSWPCLFKLEDLTAAERDELRVVEIPHKPDRRANDKPADDATRLVALNVKAWDKRMGPLVKKAHAAKKQPKASKAAKPGEKAAPPTAAELKARRKKADDQLNHFTRDWIRDAVRIELSRRPMPDLLLWLLESSGRGFGAVSITTLTEWALAESGVALGTVKSLRGLSSAIASAREFDATMWRVLLWPVATRPGSHADLAELGQLPDELPRIPDGDVDDLAQLLGVSAETVWAAAIQPGPERDMVREWLARHTRDQLADLATESAIVLADGTRDAMVDELIGHHQRSPKKKPLPLPKRIAAAAPKKRRGGDL
jgi:ParB family transcriptional regulator, chromosome partitioning protein